MTRLILLACVLISVLSSAAPAQSQPAEQKEEWLQKIADKKGGPNFAATAARIRTNTDTAFAYRQLDTLLARPYGDMFWMYGCAGLYFATRDVLQPRYKERIRWCWKHFTPYRGDTENHFLMYYGSLLLMSQEWPALADTEWFTGKSSREIYSESKDYLEHWLDETARFGQTEWNSPRYDYYYITPLVLLAEYTKDARLKQRCTMMLELVLADYAVNYLNGSYTGAHSRVSDQGAIDPKISEVSAYGDYFFSYKPEHMLEDVAFAAMSHFTCPDIIRNIALDRTKSFENLEFKRGRTTIRYSDVLNAPVYKYSYMTPDYCLGSMQGGIVQPIQQQSWSLVFNSQKPHSIVTSLHPFVSQEELGMFFPEYPSFMLERIGNVKAGYPNENKWEGGSPYEHIYQNKNVLAALYDLPDSVRYHHTDLFIPLGAGPISQPQHDALKENLHKWKMYQFDSTLIGIYMMSHDTRPDDTSLSITQEAAGWRMRSYAKSEGYVIYCRSLRDMTAEQFAAQLANLHVVRDARSIHSVEDQGRTINLPLISRSTQCGNVLFRSPFINSRKGSAVITLTYKKQKLVLNFN